MGRRKESTTSMRLPPQHQGLEVKIPSFFRCPISLDVMRSPVSLCTGVTYDRASIQRWLDSGNTTCPATMLPLPSTDLVPNLTLRSLIAHWSNSAASSCSPLSCSGVNSGGVSPAALVRQVAAEDGDPASALRELAAYLSDDDVDEFEKNALVGAAGGAAETVAAVLRRKGEKEVGVEGAEAAVRVLAAIVAMDGVEEGNKRRVAAGLAVDGAASAASLARVMGGGSGLEARVDAARLVEFLLGNVGEDEAREAVAESPELVAELVHLVGAVDEKGNLDASASGCSPAARQMASELLKMFKVNAKSCLAGYDSKTTHIMPF
uniref:U-box domain-containing protein n=1 Tax=Leersia perrieri TaxID=77586 RepID=A0A0D9W4U7_9ORYZ